jgi:glutamate formiminotransferase
VSEGRDAEVLDALRAAAGAPLVDLHADPDHHRAVLTLLGSPGRLVAAVRELAVVALERIDLRLHHGVHPRIGVLDVVPFSPLAEGPLEPAVEAREAALAVLGSLGVPCFRFGPLPGGGDRALPEVRRDAFVALGPDAGPPTASPSAGAVAVGAREPLVAWNLWLDGASLPQARALAALVRSPSVRALGVAVRGGTQVSCNLLDPARVTPLDVYRQVAAALEGTAAISRCELVGLVPEAVLAAVPTHEWAALDLAEARSVGAALAARRR